VANGARRSTAVRAGMMMNDPSRQPP
jgi:hypothetical protein